MAVPRWTEIIDACESAGLDMTAWEDSLNDRLLSYVLQRTKTEDRYAADLEFRAQVDRLLAYIVTCIIEHSTILDPKLHERAAEFDRLFQEGANEGR